MARVGGGHGEELLGLEMMATFFFPDVLKIHEGEKKYLDSNHVLDISHFMIYHPDRFLNNTI